MASEHNRIRRKWQDYGGTNAAIAEASFLGSFQTMFPGTDYSIKAKPNEFQNIYVDVQLKPEDLAQIYTPQKPITRHGVYPDYAIKNQRTEKTIYVEVKRQDGWIDEEHFFFWRTAPNPDLLFKHFDECIAPLLEN